MSCGTTVPPTQPPWRDLLPWLANYDRGPSILAADEVVPNAWISLSPRQTLDEGNIEAFCGLLAVRYVTDRSDRPLRADFPAVPDMTAITDVANHRVAAALSRAGIDTVGAVGDRTVRGLRSLPGIGPASVQDMVAALIARSAKAADCAVADDPSELPTAAVDALDADAVVVLRDRVLAQSPVPAVDLAHALGVSVQRVLGLEEFTREVVVGVVDGSPRLSELRDRLIAAARPVVPIARLVDSHPALGVDVRPVQAPLWRLLVAASPMSVVDGWLYAESPELVRGRIDDLLRDRSGADPVVPLVAAAGLLDLGNADAAAWLSLCGYTVIDDQVVVGRTTAAIIAAAMTIAARPLSMDAIIDDIGRVRSRSSIRNALVTDGRFVKTDRNAWGLRQWGLPPYRPVHQQIATLLDENSGRMPLSEVIDRITSRYDVAVSSVRMYASSGEFEVVDGTVQRRPRVPGRRKSVAKTRSLYLTPDGAFWRTTITDAHIRGSAFNIPAALAAVVGVGPDHPVTLQSRLGPQPFVWVSVQARCGTIRRFVSDLGVAIGDPVALRISRDTFDVVPLGDPAPEGRARLLQLIGRDSTSEPSSLTDVLASALGLADTSDAAILAALRHRGDDDLVELFAAELREGHATREHR